MLVVRGALLDLRNPDFPDNDTKWMYKNFAGYRDIKQNVFSHSAELQATADISEEYMHTGMRLALISNLNVTPFEPEEQGNRGDGHEQPEPAFWNRHWRWSWRQRERERERKAQAAQRSE